jgi:alpha-amylase/alpha-mannosidase (GH57 family)
MADRIHLALLWHMHQPWYVDPSNGQMALPWVRLHGISAYRDMAALLERHPGVRATISISPSLLDQILWYVDGGEDSYEQLTLRPAAELSAEERIFILRHFFSVHWAGVVAQMPFYHQLLDKRGRDIPSGGWELIAERFSVDELRDLQLLFNLAWFGFTAAEDPDVRRLLAAGHGFSEEDKRLVLHKQREILRTVLPAWQALLQRGSIEVDCSPYYHPILPLLVDTSVNKRCTPEARLPERFCFPRDAEVQIERAALRTEQTLGVRPIGLWPPEGAVSPEVLELVQRQRFRYLTTDSEILFHSLDDRGSTPGRRRLYQPYRVGECAVFFRDGDLSTSIEREYCVWADAGAAATDLLTKLRQAARAARVDGDRPPLVVVALEGENPWEAYPRRGQTFLDALYDQLEQATDIRTVTLEEHLRDYPPTVALEHLHSGSWIEANYAIWIGDPEKNRAWNLLARARKHLARAQASAEVSEAALDEALTHILRAEGSDWFRWLGEPFASAEEDVYDALLRSHVMAMYHALQDSPPADLSQPIEHSGVVETLRQPSAFIQPRVDGTRTSFFEWRGAGFYRVPAAGSMYHEHTFITGLYWGFDAGRLFLRFDPAEDQREATPSSLVDLAIWIELSKPERRITGRLRLRPAPPKLVLSARAGGRPATDLGVVEEVAFFEVVEMAIPLGRLGLVRGDRVGLSVHFAHSDDPEADLLSRVPRQGVIEIEIPGDDFGL